PCVVFFDEIDALGQQRAHLQHSAGRNVVVQLLNEMDGAQFDNQGFFVLGATNQPWDVDSAMLRPGRFDRTILVVPPDEDAREAILRYHLRDRPIEHVDVRKLARGSHGPSGGFHRTKRGVRRSCGITCATVRSSMSMSESWLELPRGSRVRTWPWC